MTTKLYLLIKLDGDECPSEMLTKWSRNTLFGHLSRNYHVMYRDLELHFGPTKTLKQHLGRSWKDYLVSEHCGYVIASKEGEIWFFQKE